jgi:hypothetical protein
LHGIAGMGKSTLLRAFLEQAAESGATVLILDCRLIEPTERGFLRAAGGFADLESLVRHLTALRPPVVLALDHCEVFGLMDTWLRQVLVPPYCRTTSRCFLWAANVPSPAGFRSMAFNRCRLVRWPTQTLGPSSNSDVVREPQTCRG